MTRGHPDESFQEMATDRWSFLGDRLGSFYEPPSARPSTLLTVSGFVHKAPPGLVSYSSFVVHAHGLQVDLLADASDAAFLDRCLAASLHCWITGQLIVRSRSKIMSCERISVWHVGPEALLAGIPGEVLQDLALAARDAVLDSFWDHKLPNAGMQAVHPLVYD